MPPKDSPEYEIGETEQEEEVEGQTLQVTWVLAGNGKHISKLLTVTDVEVTDQMVEFWNGGELVLMVRESNLLEAFDVELFMRDGE